MEIIYYVAMSVDGFIADHAGGVDWLNDLEPAEDGYGYQEFYDAVDVLVMGRATYEQVLGFGSWPYAGKRSWVMTSKDLPLADELVELYSGTPEAWVRELTAQGIERSWLVGGAQLAGAFQTAGLITEYQISIIPKFLGKGIPLLQMEPQIKQAKLTDSKTYPGGIVQLRYRFE